MDLKWRFRMSGLVFELLLIDWSGCSTAFWWWGGGRGGWWWWFELWVSRIGCDPKTATDVSNIDDFNLGWDITEWDGLNGDRTDELGSVGVLQESVEPVGQLFSNRRCQGEPIDFDWHLSGSSRSELDHDPRPILSKISYMYCTYVYMQGKCNFVSFAPLGLTLVSFRFWWWGCFDLPGSSREDGTVLDWLDWAWPLRVGADAAWMMIGWMILSYWPTWVFIMSLMSEFGCYRFFLIDGGGYPFMVIQSCEILFF